MPEEFSPKKHIQLTSENFDVVIKVLSGKECSTLNCALIPLFKEARRELKRLLYSLDDLTLASLAVRNIFEIHLISKHIYSDKKALDNWYGQSHKDLKEVTDGSIRLIKKNGRDTSELESIQEFECHSLKQSPFESKGNFQVRDLAERYGYLEDYLFVYKLSSKLIHPSSMKVMTYDVLTKNTNYLSVVLQVGIHLSHRFSDFLQLVVDENA